MCTLAKAIPSDAPSSSLARGQSSFYCYFTVMAAHRSDFSRRASPQTDKGLQEHSVQATAGTAFVQPWGSDFHVGGELSAHSSLAHEEEFLTEEVEAARDLLELPLGRYGVCHLGTEGQLQVLSVGLTFFKAILRQTDIFFKAIFFWGVDFPDKLKAVFLRLCSVTSFLLQM